MIEGWPLADTIRRRLTFFKSVRCHFLASYRAAFVSILKVDCHAIALHVSHHCIIDVGSVLEVPARFCKTVCTLSDMTCLCVVSAS